jgi:hypothetical protein
MNVDAIAAAARLTASLDGDHHGAVDLRDAWTEPGEWHVRLVWRDPRLGTEQEPEEPEGCPDLDGIEWRVDGQVIATQAVPAWQATDEWGGVIVAPDVVHVAEGNVGVCAVLVVGEQRAEVEGRFAQAPPPAPDPLVVQLVAAGAAPDAARLVRGVLDGAQLTVRDGEVLLDGLRDVDPDKLDLPTFEVVGNVAVAVRRAHRAVSDARQRMTDRWAYGVHAEGVERG